MFSEDRMSWSLKYQEEHAIRYYMDYWGVDRDAIDEIDVEGEENNFAKRLDYSGLDKVVHTNSGCIQIAQRFRRPREGGVDFSLRSSAFGEKLSEYDRLLENHKGIGSIPGVYAFGITTGMGIEYGFRDFYLFDLEKMMRKIDSDELSDIGTIPNPDGSSGIYFSLEDIASTGCVVNHWGPEDRLPQEEIDRQIADDGVNYDITSYQKMGRTDGGWPMDGEEK